MPPPQNCLALQIRFPPFTRRAPPAPLISGPPSAPLPLPPPSQYLAYRGPRVAPLASGQAWGEEHLLGVSWLALPPSPHCPQPPPSVPALRAAAAQAQRKGVCLPGNPSPCNRVSRDTAWDALTSAPKARAKPARWLHAEPSRPARGRPWGPAGRIAPPLAGKGSQKQAGEAGVGDTDPLHVNAAPPSPYQYQGPSTSGKSWLSTEEGREDRLQPRRVRADPKEDRERPRGSSIHSTAQAGSEATEGWGKGCSPGLPLLSKSPFSSGAAVSFSSPLPHLPGYQQPPGALHSSEDPYPTFLTFRPLGPLCGSPLGPFLGMFFAIRTLGMKPKLS